MNQDRNDNLPGDEGDSELSAEYRAIATERTPPELDSVVLKRAKANGADSGLRGFTAFWFRPLAFVATLGLSLALLLELTGPMDLQSNKSPDAGFGREADSSFGRVDAESEAADSMPGVIDVTGSVGRSEDSPAGKHQSVDPPAPAKPAGPKNETDRKQALMSTTTTSNAPLADADTSADFADMIEASSKQMQQQENVIETTTQVLKQSRAVDRERVGEVAAFSASAVMLEDATRACTDEQISAAARWWQCISELEEAGQLGEAKVELTLFNAAHPNFNAPEILPSQ